MGDCLQLLHFHMGSQIANVRDIANGMREATRYFVELSRLGANGHPRRRRRRPRRRLRRHPQRSYNSINYGIHHYASSIVQPLAEACARRAPPPRIVTECGRAMTAHHAVLVTNVTEVERHRKAACRRSHDDESQPVRHLRELHEDCSARRPAVESSTRRALRMRKACRCTRSARSTWSSARASTTCSTPSRMRCLARLTYDERAIATCSTNSTSAGRQVLRQLQRVRVDAGRVGDRPGVPDHPDRAPRRGTDAARVLADLTCDSDGKIDTYVESEDLDSSLPVHELRKGESYRLGFFLVGAYQEILGDIHNLFGDTDAIEVRCEGDGHRIVQQRRGDTTDVMLDYVGYKLQDLRDAYNGKVDAAHLSGRPKARC
jgi:arginine decarboxylase